MGLKKIVSWVSENRGIRKGETNGLDYIFVPFGKLEEEKEAGNLVQYTKKERVSYGYTKESLKGADELIVICGGSGVGKDSLLNSLQEKNHFMFEGTDSRFLFSVPQTLEVFYDYAKENHIPITLIYLHATEKERLRRIVRGMILENKELASKYNFDGSEEVSIDISKTDVAIDKVSVTFPFNGWEKDSVIIDIIKQGIDRVKRDRTPLSFSLGVKAVVRKGVPVIKLNVTHLNFEDSESLLVQTLIDNRTI